MCRSLTKTLLILSLFLIQNAFAVVTEFGEKYLPTTVYTTKNGLSSNNIQDIVQDEDGYLWLATENGLNRFDATNFSKYYRDKSDEYSLPGVLVEQIILMPDNELWLSINTIGITVFNKFSEKFISIKNDESKLFQMPSNNLFGIAKDKKNNVWFSIYGDGVYQWSITDGNFIEHSKRNDNPWLTSDESYEMLIDKKNRLWVCTIDSKVFLYDIDKKASKYFNFAQDVDNPASSPIYFFTESITGEIYAAGYSGVFKFNEQSQLFDTIISEQSITGFYNGVRASVKTMLVDSKNNLWIGTASGLLLYTDSILNSVTLYDDGEIIEAKWVTNSIIEGYDGNIWIGTEGAGLFKLAPDWDRYNIYLPEDEEFSDIRGSFQYKENIWIIHTDPKIDLLIINNDKLLLKKTLSPDLASHSLRIHDFFQDNDEHFLVSSISGIHKVNTENDATIAVKYKDGSSLGVVKRLVKANETIYFNAFSTKAIGYFNVQDNFAYLIENTAENHLSGDMIQQMIVGPDQNVWLATNHGIEVLNTQTHQYKILYKSIKGHDVSAIHFGINNNVWVIVNGNLKHMLWQNNKLIVQKNNFADILPLLIFSSISQLNDETLLITTKNSGYVELNIKTIEYKVYNTENGLPSNEIVNILFPNNIPTIITANGVAVSNSKYNDIPQVIPKFKIDSLAVGAKKINLKNKHLLTLDYNYESLNFNLVLLAYTNAKSVEYEYKLIGINDEWVNTGNDGKYSFYNLPAGSYTFKARGRSNYGQWSNEELYSFTVNPPPWKTIWAYLLYALLTVSIVAWIFYLYKRKLLYENKIIKETTQKQLAKQASKAKSDFLARVSHEVRTPLNGVLGMSELLQDTSLDEEQKIYTDTIIASGNHLLDIINDILDLSKIESGKLELELHNFDLLLLIDEIIGSFTSQATQKQLLFTCQFEHNITRGRIGDVIRIKQILFNLLSNAFKFTKHGEITLNITQSKTLTNGIKIIVADTGIGINNKTIEDLFKPFVQADSATTRKYGGTGLGLAIVKQLMDKMQGTITAQTKPHSGSVFSIELPLEIDKEQLPKQATLKNIHVGISIQQPNLKQSLIEYCKLLTVEVNNDINTKSQCIFVDIFKQLSPQQIQQIKIAENLQVPVVYIGFNWHNLPKELCQSLTEKQLTSPPVTFKKLHNICNNSIEEQTLKTLPGFQVATLSLKILVVEDNTINQQVSIEMLERMGHVVDVVDTAEEALVMLYRNNYNLLLSDYHLPGMDGIDMIKNWGNPNAIPVIMVTADLTDKVLQACNNLQINNIVAKPFTQQTLFTAIEKALAT